jgi:hypothetical protein
MLEPLRQTHADLQTFKEAIGISGSQEVVVFVPLSKVVLPKKDMKVVGDVVFYRDGIFFNRRNSHCPPTMTRSELIRQT